MTSSAAFVQTFQEIMGASGRRMVRSPADLVAQWDSFVRSCEEGYSDTIYEFEDERSVRDALELALTDARLQPYPETSDLKESVNAIDTRFRATCRSDVFFGGGERPWWRACVPANISGELASDVKDLYGIDA